MSAGSREASGQAVVTRVVTAPNVRCIVSRPLPGSSNGQQQVLIFCSKGICPLLSVPNAGDASSFTPKLGHPLSIAGPVASQVNRVRDAACEAQSGIIVLAVPKALLALDARNEVTRLSGSFKGWFANSCDGVGDAARYCSLRRVTAGALGCLYVMDDQGPSLEDVHLRHVQFLGGSCAVSTLLQGDGVFTYDRAFGSLLYVTDGHTINRVTSGGVMEPVAGQEGGDNGTGMSCRVAHRVDGPARLARFVAITDITADEYGNIFVLDDSALRVVQADGVVRTLIHEVVDRRRREARLTALPGGSLALWGFSNHHIMLLRLRSPQPSAAATAAAAAAAAVAAGAAAGVPPLSRGPSPLGRQARSQSSPSSATAVGPQPSRLGPHRHPAQQRQLQASSTSAASPSPSQPPSPLPSPPCIVRHIGSSSRAGGGLSPSELNWCDASASAIAETPPDVAIIAGDGSTAFPAHRAILSARCLYFRQRLSDGFRSGGGGRGSTLEHDSDFGGISAVSGGSSIDDSMCEVHLHGADPDALAAVLHHIYTGSVDHLTGAAAPPPTTTETLHGLAALSDRLLLPQLSARAQEMLLRAVQPETVVSELLWAERSGLEPLLSHLEEYFVAHASQVSRHAPESLDHLLEGASRGLVKRLLLHRRSGGS